MIVGTDPAAGVECSETVPAGVQWRLLSMLWYLVTSAVVANRIVLVRLDDGATLYYSATTGVPQTANNGLHYDVGPHGAAAAAVNMEQLLPTPVGLILLAGHRLRTLTLNLDAGDNYAAPQYMVEEWPA